MKAASIYIEEVIQSHLLFYSIFIKIFQQIYCWIIN